MGNIKKRLHLCPYRLHLLQVVKPIVYRLRVDEYSFNNGIFCDESSCHVSENMGTHNLYMKGQKISKIPRN